VRIVLLVASLGLSGISQAEECFDASKVAAQVATPFASAPLLKKSIIDTAAGIGWAADPKSANPAAYQIVGRVGVTTDKSVRVCVLEQADKLFYQVYPPREGETTPRVMPLSGSKS
jgi:hypothetical protein